MKTQLKILLLPIVLVLSAPGIAAQTGVPKFRDYSVNESFNGRSAPLVLSREARMYRTRLREAAREKPNFAGHYIVTYWGCGTECVMGQSSTRKPAAFSCCRRRSAVGVSWTMASSPSNIDATAG